jgi:hypothetical protein
MNTTYPLMKCPHAFLNFPLLAFLAALLGATTANATTFHSRTNGNWSSTSTWSTSYGGSAGTAVPGSGDVAMIEGGFTVTVDVNNATCTTLDLGSTTSGNGAGTIAFGSGSQLTVSGTVYVGADLSRTGSINMASGGTLICPGFSLNYLGTWTPGAGTVQLTYPTTLPASGITTFNNLTISSGTTTMGAALTINGNLTIGNGAAFTAGAYALSVAGTTTVGGGTSGALGISSATGTKTFNGPVVINTGGALTESAAATLSFGGDVTIGGTLTESGAAVVGIAGNLQNNGTYTAGTGVHTFSGAAKTMSGARAIAIPSVAVTGTYQNNGILTINTALSGAGGLTQGPNSTLNIGGPATTAITITTLSASANVNTIGYTGGAQTVKPTTYYNLTLSGSGAKTMTGAIISGTLDFEGTAAATFTDTPTANSLSFLGVAQASGTWGGTGSGAANIDSAHFAGTGVLKVGSGAISSTTLASSLNPSTYGSSVTLTATVTGSGPTPTGTVTFKEASTTLGSDTLNSSGAATLVLSTLSVAGSPHSITAVYGGDDNFGASSGAVTLRVLPRLSGSLASASLSGYKGSAIKVLFVAKDSAGNTLGTNAVQLATADGGSSFTYAIGVPPATATLSVKPRFYLRKKFAVPATIATANEVTLDITGAFLGGDADGNNQVDGNDYAWLRTLWGKTSNTQYDVNRDGKIDADDFPDLNGDGVTDALDYALLKAAWYQKGDAE